MQREVGNALIDRLYYLFRDGSKVLVGLSLDDSPGVEEGIEGECSAEGGILLSILPPVVP